MKELSSKKVRQDASGHCWTLLTRVHDWRLIPAVNRLLYGLPARHAKTLKRVQIAARYGVKKAHERAFP